MIQVYGTKVAFGQRQKNGHQEGGIIPTLSPLPRSAVDAISPLGGPPRRAIPLELLLGGGEVLSGPARAWLSRP